MTENQPSKGISLHVHTDPYFILFAGQASREVEPRRENYRRLQTNRSRSQNGDPSASELGPVRLPRGINEKK